MTTNLRLVYCESSPAGISPYRIVDHQDHGIRWINDFLDAQHLRSLSSRSVRSYGYDLLNFARWWCERKSIQLSHLNESRLLDYVRHQLESLPKPTLQTVNHRLTVVRCSTDSTLAANSRAAAAACNRFIKPAALSATADADVLSAACVLSSGLA